MSNREYTTQGRQDHRSRRPLSAHPGVLPRYDRTPGFFPIVDNGEGTAWLVDTSRPCTAYRECEKEARDLASCASIALEALALCSVPRRAVMPGKPPHACLQADWDETRHWCEACAIEDAIAERDGAEQPVAGGAF